MYRRLKYGVLAVIGVGSVVDIYATVSGHEKYYKSVLMPCIQLIDAEKSHVLAVKLASWGIVPRDNSSQDKILSTTLFGQPLSNPIGLAAGFDKHGECMNGMFKIGFGFVEIGSITPEAQIGNKKPRVFRLPEDKAVINRYGFNSVGHGVVMERLKKYRASNKTRGLLGINLGKNKTSIDAIDDYVKGVINFGQFADYLVINVSSPNTTGLRSLQEKTQLCELIMAVKKARDSLVGNKPPILVKIAPDLTTAGKEDIAEVVTAQNSCVDGLIVCNTTITRPDSLQSNNKQETGGLSGKPLCELSTKTVKDMYKLTKGMVPIIGVGGISSGQDAYEKIRAGASLIQLYTALGYEGPPIVKKIKRELAELLRKDGFSSLSDAVGIDVSID